LLQLVLSFDGCQVVACGNDTAVKDHKVILAGTKHDVLATRADAITGEGNENINCHMAGDASFHGMGRNCCLKGGYGSLTGIIAKRQRAREAKSIECVSSSILRMPGWRNLMTRSMRKPEGKAKIELLVLVA
jgi:hypothetical protein